MSQEEKDQSQDAETAAISVSETSNDSAVSETPDKGAADTKAKNTGTGAYSGTVTGILALAVALLSAAGSGYLWWTWQQQDNLDATVGRLRSDMMANSGELGQVNQQLDELASRDGGLQESLDAIAERLDRQAQQLGELPLRMGRLERTLDSIPGVADQARSAWLLAEAEYYLRIANAQLALASNPDVALRAQELADEKLRDVGDPGLTRVRALLADEMAAVKAVPRPDAEGLVLTLDSLAKNLDRLPLAKQAPGSFASGVAPDSTDSGLQRAWRAIVDALMSVVRIRPTEEAAIPLVTGQEESMLRRSLDVDLQIARVAVIRNEDALYRNALESVESRLRLYFDLQSSQVTAALDTIEKLAGAELPGDLPNISGSLGLLLRIGNEAATP